MASSERYVGAFLSIIFFKTLQQNGHPHKLEVLLQHNKTLRGHISILDVLTRHLLNGSTITIKCSKQSNIPVLCGAYLLQERKEH